MADVRQDTMVVPPVLGLVVRLQEAVALQSRPIPFQDLFLPLLQELLLVHVVFKTGLS